MRFIGDLHGKLPNVDIDAICVGDCGIGFAFDTLPIKYIRGNHDNPELCKRDPNYLGEFGLYQDWFFVSGARSIDQSQRIIGIDWWPDEELSYHQLVDAIYLYADLKPRFVFSHDGPNEVVKLITGRLIPSRTSSALSRMLEIHRPEIWCFGHHHKHFDKIINGTRFICLAELEMIDI